MEARTSKKSQRLLMVCCTTICETEAFFIGFTMKSFNHKFCKINVDYKYYNIYNICKKEGFYENF